MTWERKTGRTEKAQFCEEAQRTRDGVNRERERGRESVRVTAPKKSRLMGSPERREESGRGGKDEGGKGERKGRVGSICHVELKVSVSYGAVSGGGQVLRSVGRSVALLV